MDVIDPRDSKNSWLLEFKDKELYGYLQFYFGKGNPMNYKKSMSYNQAFAIRNANNNIRHVNASATTWESGTFYVLFHGAYFKVLEVKEDEIELFCCLFCFDHNVEFALEDFRSEVIVPSDLYWSQQAKDLGLILEKWKEA